MGIAFRIVNEPIANLARRGDHKRWKAALMSGAQIISTDYYKADPELKAGYEVHLPGGGAGRWNTLLLPALE